MERAEGGLRKSGQTGLGIFEVIWSLMSDLLNCEMV